ncbi:MAG: hypothetical protein ACRDPY_12205 [Streptosporangiaceae bacterium]
MKITFTKAPTFTKAIIGSAIFTIAYLASSSNLPPCSDTAAVLDSGSGECIVRQSLLHTASGWLALICLVAAVLLLVLKHKDSIMGARASLQQARQEPSAQAQAQAQAQAPAPGRASNFCAKCGTRIIAGDRFCQGCGVPMGSLQS